MDIANRRAFMAPLNKAALFPLLFLSLANERRSPDVRTKIYHEYDYIIVGGGTAGSVLANRLSEVPCVRLLLLEAGGRPPLFTEIPALSIATWYSKVDWQYQTVPQKYTGRGLPNREFAIHGGKMLGGSSSMGDHVFIRGNRNNFDEWARSGAEGWSYRDVLPYFLKLEDNKDKEYLLNGYHNKGGPQTVQKPRFVPPLKPVLHEALSDIGYPFVDSNAATQTANHCHPQYILRTTGGPQDGGPEDDNGIFDFQATLRKGQRCSTAKAYLVPAENRTNLHIVTNAMVKKILIRNQRATGVKFDSGGRVFHVKAKREVIVSAGTINTPQLLMLSGVGPRAVLETLKIPVKADLPVGQNLQDHAAILVNYELTPLWPTIVEQVLNPRSLAEYTFNRTGPYTATAFLSYVALLRDNLVRPPFDFPNYQLLLGEVILSRLGRGIYGLTPEVYEAIYGPYEFKPMFLCVVIQIQPKSRGVVSLKSTNIYDKPLIDPNYLSDRRDEDDFVEGMKTCHRIGRTKAMRKVGSTPLKTVVPGCEKYIDDEDSYFRCQLKTILISTHHPVGTAKMGQPGDPTTVVDPHLRVKHIKGLRVVDASVMPTITSGNTKAAVIMIAEKASDLIKETIDCHGNH